MNVARSLHLLRRAPWVAGVLLVAACSAPAPKPAAVSETQHESGFVISEDVRAGAEARADFERAVLLLQQKQFEQGIVLLQRVVEQAPEATAAHIDLAVAYRETGDLARAEASIERALALNPRHPVAHNELGMLHRKTGRFQSARLHYEQALAAQPSFHYARRNLAILCDIYLADLECALQHYEIYTAAVPDDTEASMWIADLRNRAAR